jgi:hypothetical protein
VKRCGVCQSKQPKVHKAKLVPLSSKALWERVEMDLLDYSNRPSHGFKYIWHAQDHFSKWHFAAAISAKSAEEVKRCVQMMLTITGPIPNLQCDNGGEFEAEVNALCTQWGMKMVKSSPYHPQSNGLIERAGAVIKRGIAKWEEHNLSNDWSEPLYLLIHQLNCTATRTTRRSPYELVYGVKPRWDSVPLDGLDNTDLLELMAADEHEDIAAALLSDMGQNATTRTPDAASSTPDTDLSITDADIETESMTNVKGHDVMEVDDLAVVVDEEEKLIHVDSDDASDEKLVEMADIAVEEPEKEMEETPAIDDIYVQDLPPGVIGAITKSMSVELDAGPQRFRRCGTYGQGRCLLSAWIYARSPTAAQRNRPQVRHRDQCDKLRSELKDWLLDIQSTDKYATMKDIFYNVGNSGYDEQNAEENGTQVSLSELKQRCWDTLLRDLSSNSADLGWECLAALSEKESINILMYMQLYLTTTWSKDTRQAKEKWLVVKRGQTKKGGWGDFVVTECSTTPVLIPRRMRQEWPFITLFHRSQKAVFISVDKNGGYVTNTTGGRGHYEALVVNASNTVVPQWNGCFDFHDVVHSHLYRIGNRILAAQYNDIARCRMEIDYNSKSSVVVYRVPNCVGVRVGQASQAGKRRQAKGTDNLPCLIVGVHTQEVGQKHSGQQVQHQQYKLLCEFGVLSNTWKVDELVPLSLNNYPQLVTLLGGLSAAELMAPGTNGWKPIDLSRYEEIGIEEAWKQHQLKKKPATVNVARNRKTTARVTAVAAETSIISSQVESRRAPNLFNSVSSQPAPQQSRPSASYIVSIIKESATGERYKVEWSNSPGEGFWELKTYIEGLPHGPRLIEEYRSRTQS